MVAVAAVAMASIGCDHSIRASASTPPAESAPVDASPGAQGLAPEGRLEEARLVRVVDGDTIIVDRGRGSERLRYIGIDTPESVIPDETPEPLGRVASDANAALLVDGIVFLERDVSETDRFGRLLRYVWVGDPTVPARWTLVNLALVSAGWATVTTFPPDVRHADRFLIAQREAQAAGRGIWATSAPKAPVTP